MSYSGAQFTTPTSPRLPSRSFDKYKGLSRAEDGETEQPMERLPTQKETSRSKSKGRSYSGEPLPRLGYAKAQEQ